MLRILRYCQNNYKNMEKPCLSSAISYQIIPLLSKSIFSKVSFMNLHLKMYYVWLLVGNTVVVYMSGVLNSKLKFQHDFFFFFFGLRDQSQYRWLEVMQIHATPSLKHKNVLISNFLCKHCYRDRMMSLREQQQKTTSFYAVVKIKYNSTHA